MKMDNVEGQRIAEKWGFGMAPPKPATQDRRREACARMMGVLSTAGIPESTSEIMQSMSEVKGLFNRVVREDQWDWFTVSSQLGYPSRRISRVIAQELTILRKATKDKDPAAFRSALSNLRRLPTRKCLSVFLGDAQFAHDAKAGWIYVLSTREFRELLKIGMTSRTVEQRAREISNATGVAIPFGVRRCWRVSNPTMAERKVHHALEEYRLRNDREFFRIPFTAAAEKIESVVRENGLEMRTLDHLSAVQNLPDGVDQVSRAEGLKSHFDIHRSEKPQ